MSIEEKTFLINGINTNYKIAGDGDPLLISGGNKVLPSQERGTVLILHGWGGSSDSWIEVQTSLAKQGYKVIAPDFPGFGKSITPPEPWSLSDYLKWLLDFINFLRLENFCLLAHSFGGRVAIKFAVQYPEKIKSLILCASAGIKPKPSLKTLIIFWLARIGNAIFTPKHLTRFKDSVRNLLYIFLRNKDYVKANGTMKETIKNVLNEDLLADLPYIKTKTLLIWGELDRMVPLKYAYIFKEKVGNSELEILPKIGHSPHLEAPEKLSEILLNYLNRK